MAQRSTHSVEQKALRGHAEDRLKSGSAPLTQGWMTSTDALNLLHKLSSSPGSAADALKLLHELQVHQVELDLQHEQIEASELELNEELVAIAQIFDFAPVGCFCISSEGTIDRVNIAGAALCGEDRTKLIGRRMKRFLAPESWPVLETLVALVRNGVPDQSCEVRTRAGSSFHVKASVVPGQSCTLMVFVDLGNSIKPAPRA